MFFVRLLIPLFCTSNLLAADLRLFDTHSHYTQEDAEQYTPQQIIHALDQAGIDKMVVIGRPAPLALTLYRQAHDRILPFLGIYRDLSDKSNWAFDLSLPARVEDALLAARAKGTPYLGLGEIHLFKPMRKSPVFRRLVSLAAKYQLPLMIHGDTAVIDQALEWEPELTVIWAHLGARPSPALINAVLARHPKHLYVDTSVRDDLLVESGRLKPQWRALFLRHPERILLGVDTFSTQRWGKLEEITHAQHRWLKQLPEEIAQNIAQKNADAFSQRRRAR